MLKLESITIEKNNNKFDNKETIQEALERYYYLATVEAKKDMLELNFNL